MSRHTQGWTLTAALAIALAAAPAEAWRGGSVSGYRGSASWGGGSGSAEGRFGGSANWSHGSGSATGAYGGSASWNRSSGGTATTARGGTAAWNGSGSGSASSAYGGSASWHNGSGSATGANGNSATWNHNTYYARPPAGYYPPPVRRPVPYPVPAYGHSTVYYNNSNYNATTGEVVAAGVAGLAVGAMVGSAAAKSQQQQQTAAAPPQQPSSVSQPLPVGAQLSSLPPGCANATVKSMEYYICGPNWFKPVFGGNGVYYQVVAAP